MKLKLFFFSLVCSGFCFNTFAENYDIQIKSLQKQIDELSKKIEIQENKNNSLLLNNLTFSGRIHVGATWYDENNELKSYNNSSFNDKTTIKRMRLSINKEFDKFIFNFEGNFHKNQSSLGNTYIGYAIDKENQIKIGQVMTPSFMEKLKSTNTMATIAFNSFENMGWTPVYLIGLNYDFIGNGSGFSAGIFGNGTDTDGKLNNDMAYNFSLRNFYSPIKNKNWSTHLGYNLVYQDYKSDLINNPTNIDNTYLYGLEFGLQYKNMNLASEFIKKYYQYTDESRFGKANFNFEGLSTEFVINFTAEQRQYNKWGYFDDAHVKSPLSKGGYGAWQGVLRYSFANGKDTYRGSENNIGSQYDYTVGIAWIPEDYFRILFNYSKNKVAKMNDNGDYTAKGKYDAYAIEARIYF